MLSGSTRRRDQEQKRTLYLDAGVGEYWIVDPERRSVRTVRRGIPDATATGDLEWAPGGVAQPLRFDVRLLFD